MHWVYVLRDSNNGSIYVGETIRLCRRLNEHQTGRGGVNTSCGNYDTIIGIYSVKNNASFWVYRDMLKNGEFSDWCDRYWGYEEDKDHALIVENLITERFMLEYPDIYIRGGKYTIPRKSYKVNTSPDRPLCDCGYPCEINIKKDKTKLYFSCPLSRPANWNIGFSASIEESCDFYEEFKDYRVARNNYEIDKYNKAVKRYEWWVSRLPEYYINNKCLKCVKTIFEGILDKDKIQRNICYDCFHSKFDELKNEYIDKPRDIRHIFSDTIETT